MTKTDDEVETFMQASIPREELSTQFNQAISTVRLYTNRFENDIYRPALRSFFETFKERPILATFLATLAILSYLPALAFLTASIWTLVIALVISLSAAFAVIFALFCILFFTLVASVFIAAVITAACSYFYLAFRLISLVRQNGPSDGFLSWIDEILPFNFRRKANPAAIQHRQPSEQSTVDSDLYKNMRPLTEEESKAVFTKLANYIGRNLVHLIDRPDEPHCFRLHKDRVYYVSESSMRLGISVARPNLASLGTCFGKFSKSHKFKLHITALDFLAQYAKYKVWIKPNGEMPFLYGNHVVKAHLGRVTEDTPEHQGVVVYNMNDIPLGFGVTARSTVDTRKLDPTAIVVFHQADVGEYLRDEASYLLTAANSPFADLHY